MNRALELAFARFESPAYLLLLLLIPVLILLSFRSLSGLGGIRRIIAIAMRCLVVSCMVLALAGAQCTRTHDRLAVIFALDRSSSVSPRIQQQQFEFIRRSAEKMRPDDRLAVLAFDGESAIEQLPMGALGIDRISEPVAPDQTNAAAALRMAMALFPKDAARRLVVLSDGNENVGLLLEEADWFAANNVPIDVLPALFENNNEILFERLVAPPTATAEETIKLHIVLRNNQQPPRSVTGRLTLRHLGKVLDINPDPNAAAAPITLEPGLNRFDFNVPLRKSGAHRFSAVFEPDDATTDTIVSNNEGRAFTIVSGQGAILILTSSENEQSAKLLEKALESEKLVCEIEIAGERPIDPIRLVEYSLVILSNVPANLISDEEQLGLTTYVRDLGGGLIMIGGDAAFGAGGWLDSPVEAIMPVKFDVKSTRQIPKGALVLVMHASEIPKGNYWAERVAVAAVKTLSSRDMIGVVSYRWRGDGFWDVPYQRVGNKRSIIQKIKNMQMGDMPDLDEVMRPAVKALAADKDAAARHMIVISDFDPMPPGRDLIAMMNQHSITCSTVAIGYGGHRVDESKARWIAKSTGGRFYRTNKFSELPKIFIKEARIVRRMLINEIDFRPTMKSTLPETVAGFSPQDWPPLSGYVVTTSRPLAQLPLVAVTDQGEDPIFAHWQVGLGRTVAFTSGMWPKWGSEWASWPGFSKFWAQVARWASRQSQPAAFDVATSLEGGRGKIHIRALDSEAASMDFLNIQGALITPDHQTRRISLRQIGPGEYEGEFDARLRGNYLINLRAVDNQNVTTQLQTGLSIAYSPEYRETRSNLALLTQLARRTGGRVLSPDQVIEPFQTDGLAPAQTHLPVWEMLVKLMLLLFLLDVAVRRIAISPIEVARKARRWLAEMAGRGRTAEASVAVLSSLKATREQLRDEMKSDAEPASPSEAGVAPSRSARYEAPATEGKATEDLTRALGGADEQDAPVVARPTRKAAPISETEYTSRLLRAKRRARQERDDDKKS